MRRHEPALRTSLEAAPAAGAHRAHAPVVVVLLAVAGAAAVAAAAYEAPAPPGNAFWNEKTLPSVVQDHGLVFVGYEPTTFEPTRDYEAARIDAAVAEWRATHTQADVKRVEPVFVLDHLVGYTITYAPTGNLPAAALPVGTASVAPATGGRQV